MAVEIVVRAVGIAGRVTLDEAAEISIVVTESEVVEPDGTVTFLGAELAVFVG